MSLDSTSIRRLVFWPAVVTLAITLLRLTGELLHWSPTLFNPAPGGGGALVGISWLPPVFGVLFAIQPARAGYGPRSGGRAIGMAVRTHAAGVCLCRPHSGRAADAGRDAGRGLTAGRAVATA
jgi:hypothetical protein